MNEQRFATRNRPEKLETASQQIERERKVRLAKQTARRKAKLAFLAQRNTKPYPMTVKRLDKQPQPGLLKRIWRRLTRTG